MKVTKATKKSTTTTTISNTMTKALLDSNNMPRARDPEDAATIRRRIRRRSVISP
jgi:hypothetical protein